MRAAASLRTLYRPLWGVPPVWLVLPNSCAALSRPMSTQVSLKESFAELTDLSGANLGAKVFTRGDSRT